jgi:hypothetical protein
MSTDRDTTRIVRSWLMTDEHESADRVLHAVLDRLDTTPQRRLTWWPARRSPEMNTFAKFGLAAAAMAVATLLGYNYLVSLNIGGPGPGDPTPAATPSPSPMPLPISSSTAAQLEPGTYVAGDPFSLRVTFTVPDGWRGNIGGPYYVGLEWIDQSGGIFFQIFDKLSADPCRHELGFLDPPPGPTVEDLVTALGDMPGLDVTNVAGVTVDGYNGTQLVMTAPESVDGCTGAYVIWQLPLGLNYSMAPGERSRVWILDVDGQRLVIESPEVPGYTDAQRTEVQEIIDSIRIEPTN